MDQNHEPSEQCRGFMHEYAGQSAIFCPDKILPALFIALMALAVSACSSINRAGAIKNAQFLQGVTTKPQVVNAIGLPDNVKRDDTNNTEYWLYSDVPTTVDYILPITAVLTANSPQYDFGGPLNHVIKQNSHKPIALICEFDAKGILVGIVRVREAPQ